MKTLIVSLLLFAFAQGAQAVPLALNEGQSKKVYNILAAFGLRTPFPADMQTREWAHPAVCVRVAAGGSVSYACQVHDNFHAVDVTRTGLVAKKLYHFIRSINGAQCEGVSCRTLTNHIQCAHFWPNKDNPPRRRYLCAVDKISAGLIE